MTNTSIPFDASLGFLTGAIYSLFFTSLGGRYLQFLWLPSLLQSLYFGLLVSIIFVTNSWIVSRFRSKLLWCTSGILLAVHFFFWLHNFSILSTLDSSIQNPTILAIVLILFGIVSLRGLIPDEYCTNKKISLFLFLFLVLVFTFKSITLIYLPQIYLDSRVLKDTPGQSKKPKIISRLLYPLSLPLEKSIQRYKLILPSIPEGQKIITVVFDAFREDYFGKEISGIQLTPNISSFADKHHYFQNYYVQGNWTKPSVASFFTGKYIYQHATFKGGGNQVINKNKETRITRESGHILPGKYLTLAERLRQSGFDTISYVSIPHISSNYNFNQGFDYYRYTSLRSVPENFHAIRALTFWILRRQPEDLFIYLHLLGPHFGYDEGLNHNNSFWKKTSYKTSQNLLDQWSMEKEPIELIEKNIDTSTVQKSRRERDVLEYSYSSDVNYYDRVVFPLITDTLKHLDFFKESLFVLTSDHGELIWDHQGYFGHGKYLTEEITNVPLLVKLPKKSNQKPIKFDSFQDTPVLESLDLTATLANYANAKLKGIQGKSFIDHENERINSGIFSTGFAEETHKNKIKKAAVINPPWIYQYDYRTKNGQLQQLISTGESKSTNYSPNQKQSLEQKIIEFNSKGHLKNKPPPLKRFNQNERRKLKGLGYLDN